VSKLCWTLRLYPFNFISLTLLLKLDGNVVCESSIECNGGKNCESELELVGLGDPVEDSLTLGMGVGIRVRSFDLAVPDGGGSISRMSI